jgi:hypothetical protein
MALESNPAYTAFHGGAAGPAYNEAAFRHFLGIERRRAERSARVIVLVLVSLRSGAGRNAVLDPASAGLLFSGLGAAVREVDFVGWYRDGRVAGAVLTQHAAPPDDVRDRVSKRVTRALDGQAPAGMPLRVRVICVRPRQAALKTRV